MDPLRQRIWPLAAVMAGSPVCAEYLQAYLPSTGDLPVMLGSLLVLGPLYGGAALLIREVAVRRRLGWTGILLLAAGFGLLMPGVVDLALFGQHRSDIEYWDALREGTLIGPLGISAYGAITWTVSHMLLSIGAPLALLDVLAPRHRGRPLLGRRGIVTVTALWLAAAALIHADGTRIYDFTPSAGQLLPVLVIVALIGGLGLSPVGRPVAASRPGHTSAGWLLVGGAVGLILLDFVPWTWAGVSVLAILLAGAGLALRRRATTLGLDVRGIGTLAAGALVGRTATAFLAPIPADVAAPAKFAQNAVLLAATLAIAVLVSQSRGGDGARADSHLSSAPAPPRERGRARWRSDRRRGSTAASSRRGSRRDA